MYDVIEIAPNGETIVLAASQFCTRYWSGKLEIFKALDKVGLSDAACGTINLEGGVACARFVSDSKVMVGLDTGCVALIDVAQSDVSMTASTTEHDGVVATLATCGDRSRAATGSYDRCVKVWSTEYLVCQQTYRPAHVDLVRDVAFHPEGDSVLASVSEDGRIVLWDTRQSRPARELDRLPISRPSCLTFRRNGNLVVGTVSGRLVELDAGFNLPALDLGIHGRSVHRLVVAPHDDTLIASCADEAAVVVTSVDPAQPHVIYSDSERHGDYVRGLAWTVDGGRLLSCGWDRRVVAHDLSQSGRRL